MLCSRLGHRLFSAAASPRLKAVMLNADRLDFDGRLDFSRLEPVAELTRHAASDPARPDEILERLTGQAVVINKEMPISAASSVEGSRSRPGGRHTALSCSGKDEDAPFEPRSHLSL